MRRSSRVPLRALLPAAALGLLLTGCVSPDNSPKTYDDVLKANFLSGCTQDYNGTPATLNTRSQCQCMYDVLAENVPASADDKTNRTLAGGAKKFDGYDGKTLAEIEHEVRQDVTKITSPDVVKQSVIDQIKGCPGKVAAQGQTPGSTAVVGPVAPGGTTGGTSGGTTPGTLR